MANKKTMKQRKTLLVSNSVTSAPQYIVGASASADAKLWDWGGDNLTPQRYALLLRKSVAHRRIVNDKSDYVAGKGFAYDENNERLARVVERANGAESLQLVVKRTAFDYVAFGNAFVEVVIDKGVVMFFHHDATTVRLDKEGNAVIDSDWTEPKRTTQQRVSLYPVFTQREDGSLRSIIHYKDYEPTFNHYGVPAYVAGLLNAQITHSTDVWNKSRLDNSFQPSGVMDVNVESEDEAQEFKRKFEQSLKGESNAGKVLYSVKMGATKDEAKTTFTPITSNNEGDWLNLHNTSIDDIVVAHSWGKALSGLDYTSGFSADRVLNEYNIALNTIIRPLQTLILAPIKAQMEAQDIDCSSLEIVNTPPLMARPAYMMVWEARKADGLEYDPADPAQQVFLANITKSATND